MPNASQQAERILKRIDESANSITVVFPSARTPATGTSPGATLVNPLRGPAIPHSITGADPTPTRDPVTMKCLFQGGLANDRTMAAKLTEYGWDGEADAMARVKATDAETAPGKTYFDACDHVEVNGRHYTVLQVQPVGPGFAGTHSYSVWLKTQRRQ